MITFKSITLRNFLSYGNVPTVVILDRPGTTLVLGEDLDNTGGGAGANGVGKASWINAQIKTPEGWIRMGDVSVGQTLQMPDGSVAPVTGVFPQGKQPLYKVTFADGRSTKVTEEHLWTVFSHRWGKQGTRGTKTATTKDLIKYLKECVDRDNKPWYNIFVPTVSHPDVSDKKLPIDSYLLGVLLGDGCISQGTGMISSADKEIIEDCQQILNEQHNQKLVLEECKNSSGYDWHIRNMLGENDSIKAHLQKMELYGCVSNAKFVPTEYLEGTSKQQKIDLLAGLLDTDGTVNKTKNVSFCSVSEQLAKDVQYLVRSLGGKATISTRLPHYTNTEGNKVAGQLAYNVSVRYSNPTELFRLDRKKQSLTDGPTQYANEGLRVTSVERVEDDEAQCIMVDHPDHLYITDNFIVTHNTVLLNALVYGVYDKPVSSISKDNLVNNINKKNMQVSVDFSVGKDEYKVERTRKMKSGAAGNFVHLFKNGKDITPDSVSNTNAMIEKIVGIPYDLFVRIVAFSATHIPFLDLPVRSNYGANQTDIIEELFDLKTLSEKALVLKEEAKTTDLTLQAALVQVSSLEREHARHEKQVESAERRVANWIVQNNKEIDDIQKKLDKIAGVDVEQERVFHEKIVELSGELKEANTELKSIERKVKAFNKTVDDKTSELDHLTKAKCPYCLQKYEDANEKINETKSEIKKAKDGIKQYEKLLVESNGKIEELAETYEEISGKITVSNLNELLEIKGKNNLYKRRLKDLQKMKNPFIEPLDELLSTELDPIDKSVINELRNTHDHQKFLIKLLTKKDSFVRKALLNKNIPFLNQRLAHYLTELGLPHTVEFTHKMTASISQFGRPLDFGNLSNGQRARVNLALSFAFRDALQSMHEHINVCMLDEVLDVGLDTVGVQAAARMLKRKARNENISVYIISHRDEIDSAFDHKMTVQLSKGFSYVTFEE